MLDEGTRGFCDWLGEEQQWTGIDEQWESERVARKFLEWLTSDLHQWRSTDDQWDSESLADKAESWLSQETDQWRSTEAQWLSEEVASEQKEWITTEFEQWRAVDRQWIGEEKTEEEGGATLKSYFSIPEIEAHGWQNVGYLDSRFVSYPDIDAVLYARNYLLPQTVYYNKFDCFLEANFVKRYTAELEFRSAKLKGRRAIGWNCDEQFAAPSISANFVATYNLNEAFSSFTATLTTEWEGDGQFAAADISASFAAKYDLDEEIGSCAVDAYTGLTLSEVFDTDSDGAGTALEDSWLIQNYTLDKELSAASVQGTVGASLDKSFSPADLTADFSKKLDLDSEFSVSVATAVTSSCLEAEMSTPVVLDARCAEDFCLEGSFQTIDAHLTGASRFDGSFQPAELFTYVAVIGPGFNAELSCEFSATVLEDASFGTMLDATMKRADLAHSRMTTEREFFILKYEEAV